MFVVSGDLTGVTEKPGCSIFRLNRVLHVPFILCSVWRVANKVAAVPSKENCAGLLQNGSGVLELHNVTAMEILGTAGKSCDNIQSWNENGAYKACISWSRESITKSLKRRWKCFGRKSYQITLLFIHLKFGGHFLLRSVEHGVRSNAVLASK